jgi:TRAP-type mannitol/chloroaromatic compound transport system permease small subunit
VLGWECYHGELQAWLFVVVEAMGCWKLYWHVFAEVAAVWCERWYWHVFAVVAVVGCGRWYWHGSWGQYWDGRHLV